MVNLENVRNVCQPGAVRVTSSQKPGRRLPDWLIGEWQRCCASHFVALPVDGFCRTTAVGGFLGVSISLVAAGTAGGLRVAGATGAAAGAAVTGLTGNNCVRLWCSRGYIGAGQRIWLDSIWMTFTDVVTCTSVLTSPLT